MPPIVSSQSVMVKKISQEKVVGILNLVTLVVTAITVGITIANFIAERNERDAEDADE